MADKAPEQSAPAPKKDAAPVQDEPLTLSKSELQKLIDDNRREAEEAASARLAKEQEKAKAEREEEEARKRGEFEKLANKEKERADALAAENRKLQTAAALRDHLTEKHPEYAASAKYILPLIPADAEGDALAKAVAEAAAQFVKDNPRTPKGAAGAPPAQPRTPAGGVAPTEHKPNGSPAMTARRSHIVGGF